MRFDSVAQMQSQKNKRVALARPSGTNHDAISTSHRSTCNRSHMTEPFATADQSHEIRPPIDRGMSITKAAVITAISLILVIVSSYGVVKGSLSAGMTRLLAVVALLALVGLAYGLIELALAVVATTAERRRQAREVSERRQGDRARKPTPH